jgi:hypothetical protein
MKNLCYFIVSFLLIYGLSSCAGSKKIDFDTAYKFSTYKYQTCLPTRQESINQEEHDKDYLLDAVGLVASAEPDSRSVSTVDISDFEKRMYQKIGVSVEEGANMELEEMKTKVHQLTWKEKRDIRKSIKQELKHMNLEAENVYSTMDVQRVNQISEMTRWAIIIGSVGLVLLILGAIFTGVLTVFGAIFVVGAAVLFILDQV